MSTRHYLGILHMETNIVLVTFFNKFVIVCFLVCFLIGFFCVEI